MISIFLYCLALVEGVTSIMHAHNGVSLSGCDGSSEQHIIVMLLAMILVELRKGKS
jgi:hypothetical protein